MDKGKKDGDTLATTATQPTYPEAVTMARRFLESWMAGNGQGLVAGKSLADPCDWKAMNNEVLGAAMLRKRPDDLVDWANADRDGWDALQLGLANAVERGNAIPAEARQWLGLFLRGEIERPHGSAGTHSAEGLHLAIYMAIHALTQRGIKATRNDASAPVSACDAVADALVQLGKEPTTFHGVKRVWQAMKKQVKPGIPRS